MSLLWCYAPNKQRNPCREEDYIETQEAAMERLFVYGIFLDYWNRLQYGMINPEYATVKDYATFGNQIVEAVHIPGHGLSLTGLTVDIPSSSWKELDLLEAGYDRKQVTTTDGEEVWMYVSKDIMEDDKDGEKEEQ